MLDRERKIKDAILNLDPKNAHVWTMTGKPQVSYIRQKTRIEDLTSAEMNEIVSKLRGQLLTPRQLIAASKAFY